MTHSFLPLLYMLQYATVGDLQHSTVMYAWFSVLHCHSCSGGLLCDLQNLRHVVFWVVHVRMLGRMGTKFPSMLCKCLRRKTCCVKYMIVAFSSGTVM